MQRLQSKGLELFYTNGFYNTSIDDILKELSLSKGAFYYHFSSKEDFFIQIIQNNLAHKMYNLLVAPIQGNENPIRLIIDSFEDTLETAVHNDFDIGCILGNFTTEFNGKNDVIAGHLSAIVSVWEANLVAALQKGKFNGHLDRHVDCEAAATFIISSYFGIRSLISGKNASVRKYKFMIQLKHYLKSIEAKKEISYSWR